MLRNLSRHAAAAGIPRSTLPHLGQPRSRCSAASLQLQRRQSPRQGLTCLAYSGKLQISAAALGSRLRLTARTLAVCPRRRFEPRSALESSPGAATARSRATGTTTVWVAALTNFLVLSAAPPITTAINTAVVRLVRSSTKARCLVIRTAPLQAQHPPRRGSLQHLCRKSCALRGGRLSIAKCSTGSVMTSQAQESLVMWLVLAQGSPAQSRPPSSSKTTKLKPTDESEIFSRWEQYWAPRQVHNRRELRARLYTARVHLVGSTSSLPTRS